MIIMERTLLASISSTSGHKHTATGCGETAPMSSLGCRSSSSTTANTRNHATSSSSRWSAGHRRRTAGHAAHRRPASCAGGSSIPTKTCTCTGAIRASAARSAGGSRSCPTRPESTRPWSGRTGEIWRTIVATTTGHGWRWRRRANLARVPGTSASGDEVLTSQTKETVEEIHLGPKLHQDHYDPFYNSPYQNEKIGSGSQGLTSELTPTSSTTFYPGDHRNNGKGSQPGKKEKQARGGISIIDFGKTQEKHLGFGIGKSNHVGVNFSQRQLLTEGDVPIGREKFMEDSFSPNLIEKVRKAEEKNKARNMKGKENKNINKAEVSASKSGRNAILISDRKGQVRAANEGLEHQEVLSLNNISDGVQYGIGGVGYSAGGRREKKQEGEPIERSLERREKNDIKGQSAGEAGGMKNPQTTTMNRWKHELFEIQKDIERRKHSYEKVNRFFTICDENGSFVDRVVTENPKEMKISFAGKPNPRTANYYSRSTQQTLQTLQTQPIHTLPDRPFSPHFSSLSSKVQSNNKDYIKHVIKQSREKSNERARKREHGDTKIFLDWKSTDVGTREDQMTNENRSRVKTTSQYYDFTTDTREINASFAYEPTIERRNWKTACCGTGSGCQMF